MDQISFEIIKNDSDIAQELKNFKLLRGRNRGWEVSGSFEVIINRFPGELETFLILILKVLMAAGKSYDRKMIMIGLNRCAFEFWTVHFSQELRCRRLISL